MLKRYFIVILFFVFLGPRPLSATEKTCLERASSYALARLITVVREHNNGRANYNADALELMNSASCAHAMNSVVDEHVRWDFSFCLGSDNDPSFPEYISFEQILSFFSLTKQCAEFEGAYSKYQELSEQMTNNTLDSTQLCIQSLSLLQDYHKNCARGEK